ncbi:MAG TPA: transposase [Candidatus Thermoplasmatota archaeon]|nr:transposase [Candidatus Thermoplasmatota archaeon]
MPFVKTTTVGGRKYQYLVRSVWDPEKGQPRHEVVRYLGAVNPKTGKPKPPRTRVDGVQSATPIGRLAIFWSIAHEAGLPEIAERVLGSRMQAERILVLALNQALDRRSLTKAVTWANDGLVRRWLGFEPVERADLESTLAALCHVEGGTLQDAGGRLQQELTVAWRHRYSKQPAEAYYDVTKVLYHGSDCSLAEISYQPGHRGQHALGVGLVVSRQDAFPILCRPLPGSRSDAITMPDMVQLLKAEGFTGLTLVVDRGILNAKNLAFARKNGFHVLGGCPNTGHEVRNALGHFTEEDLMRPAGLVHRSRDHVGYVRGWRGRLGGVPGRFVLAYDPLRRAQEATERDTLIAELDAPQTDAARRTQIQSALRRILRPARGRRGFVVDDAARREEASLDGRFLLFTTNTTLDDRDVFRIYFQKDEIEKVFRSLKGDVRLGPVRYRRPERIQAYLTIVFAAYLLRAIAAHKLRVAGYDGTLEDALDAMDSWAEVEFTSDGRPTRWRTQTTEAQRKLIRLFDVEARLPSP